MRNICFDAEILKVLNYFVWYPSWFVSMETGEVWGAIKHLFRTTFYGHTR